MLLLWQATLPAAHSCVAVLPPLPVLLPWLWLQGAGRGAGCWSGLLHAEGRTAGSHSSPRFPQRGDNGADVSLGTEQVDLRRGGAT